jgi:aerobic C4-dicarboxylate transport protein
VTQDSCPPGGRNYTSDTARGNDDLLVATLTSKGASGVQGAAFIALVATLSVVPTIPVAGMALILGIDRFMSMFRALVNMIGNGVATLVVARWENELDREALRGRMA